MQDDRTAIADTLIRYASGIDQRDWPLFRTCFTEDVVAEYDTMGTLEGLDTFVDVFEPAHAPMGPTFHRISNIVIEVDGDRAKARSYVHAVLVTSPESQDNWVDVVGSYEDELVRTADGWRIARRVSRTARMLTAGEQPGIPE